MNYSFRKSAFEKEKSYELTQDGIKITDHEGIVSLVKYADILQVNLSFVSTKHNSFYQCDLKLKTGSSLLFKSQHYAGIANFEDRSADYSDFINGLHKILNASGLGIKYKKGISSVGYYASMAVFIIAGILFPIVSIGMLIGGQIIFGALGVFVSIMLFLRMKKYMKKNKPGEYTPDQLPETLIPLAE